MKEGERKEGRRERGRRERGEEREVRKRRRRREIEEPTDSGRIHLRSIEVREGEGLWRREERGGFIGEFLGVRRRCQN